MARNSDLTKFKGKVNRLFGSIAKANRSVHDCLVEGLAHFNTHSHDTSYVEVVVNRARQAEADGFRFQAVAYWITDYAKLAIRENEDGSLTVRKSGKVDYDRGWFDNAKENPWFKVAAAEKPLTAPKLPESVVIQLAKGLAVGTISVDDINAFAAGLLDKARASMTDDKVISFMEKWNEQNKAAA